MDRLAEQTFQDFKIIACDDGSTDHTYQILKEYESGRLAGKLKVITHPDHKNRGIYPTYDLCLKDVDTEFFLGHASDDYLERNALEFLVGTMDADPQADFAYGPCRLVDDKSRDLHRLDGIEDIGGGVEAAEKFITYNAIREPTIFYRRSCMPILTHRPSSLVYGDWYQNMLLFLEKKPRNYRTPVVNYRMHSSNISVGRPVQEFADRSNDVAAALYEHPSVRYQPVLKCGLLAVLQSDARRQTPATTARKEMTSALAGISDPKKKIPLLMRCWAIVRTRAPRATGRLMEILPWWTGVVMLLHAGSLNACDSVKKSAGSAGFGGDTRLLSQLLTSLTLRAGIVVRDCLKITATILCKRKG